MARTENTLIKGAYKNDLSRIIYDALVSEDLKLYKKVILDLKGGVSGLIQKYSFTESDDTLSSEVYLFCKKSKTRDDDIAKFVDALIRILVVLDEPTCLVINHIELLPKELMFKLRDTITGCENKVIVFITQEITKQVHHSYSSSINVTELADSCFGFTKIYKLSKGFAVTKLKELY